MASSSHRTEAIQAPANPGDPAASSSDRTESIGAPANPVDPAEQRPAASSSDRTQAMGAPASPVDPAASLSDRTEAIGAPANPVDPAAMEVSISTITNTEKSMHIAPTAILHVKNAQLIFTEGLVNVAVIKFNLYSFLTFLEKVEFQFPFLLNPTPRQIDLIRKFQTEAKAATMEEQHYKYPNMTAEMSAFITKVLSKTDFSRTEAFLETHFLGMNLSYLKVFVDIGKMNEKP